MTPQTTGGYHQNRAHVATTALSIFKARYGCQPAKRPDLLAEWNDLLDQLKEEFNHQNLKKPKPVGERSEQILAVVGASKKPLTLNEISKRIDAPPDRVQGTISKLVRRGLLGKTEIRSPNNRRQYLYSLAEVEK